jgi:hypothetical protein
MRSVEFFVNVVDAELLKSRDKYARGDIHREFVAGAGVEVKQSQAF